VPQHSIPPRATEDLFKKHTTHFSAADSRWQLGALHRDDQHKLRLKDRGARNRRCFEQ
jgi:hypothetical protein